MAWMTRAHGGHGAKVPPELEPASEGFVMFTLATLFFTLGCFVTWMVFIWRRGVNPPLARLLADQQQGLALLDGQQVGADLSRVEEAKARLETVYAEMDPGDGLFFHCNTLHRSDQNRSADRRWTLICCYNAARNDPYREHHHPRYTKLDKVPDDAIRAAGLRFSDAAHDGAFLKRATAPKDLATRGGAVFDRDAAR